MLGVAEAEERLALRERVAVQQEPLLRPCCYRLRGSNVGGIARLPAQQVMLPALAIARVIGIRTVGLWHGGIVLLDAALHFGKQRVLQAFGVGERALAIVVLSLQT